MKAIINKSFKSIFYMDGYETGEHEHEVDSDSISVFEKGDEVEILKVINNSSYADGVAYVIFNTKNDESITVHGGVLDFTPTYEVGDIVLVPRGQKTRFFEVINTEGNYFWITDGNVQIKKTSDEIELICKARNRKDDKVPNMKFIW